MASFDSDAFDTNAFDTNAWDLGEAALTGGINAPIGWRVTMKSNPIGIPNKIVSIKGMFTTMRDYVAVRLRVPGSD